MSEALREFRDRLGLGSFVVVADHGMVSAANLQALRSEGIEYVVAERLRRSTANEALARAGRHKKVARNLRVKEITSDGAERVLLCHYYRVPHRGRAAARRHRAAARSAHRARRRAGPARERRARLPQADGRHRRDRPKEGPGGRPLRREVAAAHHDQLAAGAGRARLSRPVAGRERAPHHQDATRAAVAVPHQRIVGTCKLACSPTRLCAN